MMQIFRDHDNTTVNAHAAQIPEQTTQDSSGVLSAHKIHGLLLAAAKTTEEMRQIRVTFGQVSGYHTLTKELEWMQTVDAERAFSRHAIMSLLPGKTHLMFLSACYQGPSEHKQFLCGIINSAATVVALILSATLGFFLDPPDAILDLPDDVLEDYPWVPKLYHYSLACHLGCSLACIFVSFYVDILTSWCTREADWLRIMFKNGDTVVVYLLLLFVTAMVSIMPAMYAIWVPKAHALHIDLPGSAVAVILPIVVSLIGVVCFWGISGGLDLYWLRKGASNDDSPDLDCLIGSFEAKIKIATELRACDDELHAARSLAQNGVVSQHTQLEVPV